MSLQHERLADEREHMISGLKLALMLGLTLAAVVAVNAWAVKASPVETRTYDGLTVVNKWELASAGAPVGGVVVVGDSGGNFGIVGSVLTAELGAPSVNLCTYGRFLMTGARWMLDEAVENADGMPALAIVVIGSQTLVKENLVDGFKFAELPVSLGAAAKGSAGVTAVELSQMAVAEYFPLYTQSRTLGEVVRGVTYPNGQRRYPIDPSVLAFDSDGSSIIPWHDPAAIAAHTEKKIIPEILGHEGPIPAVRDRAAIERMIQDADSRGYDLVFVDGPVWSGLASRAEQVELMGEFHGYLDAICATSERAWHLPGPAQTFEAEDMENAFHLMRPAAERYTAEVATRLQALALPR